MAARDRREEVGLQEEPKEGGGTGEALKTRTEFHSEGLPYLKQEICK